MRDSQNKERELSRRQLLSAAVFVTATAATRTNMAGAINDTSELLEARRKESADLRHLTTAEAVLRPFPNHPTNGDEEKLTPKYIGNFCKGLPQNEYGVVEPDAYDKLISALTSGNPSDFEAIPLGQAPNNSAANLRTLAKVQKTGNTLHLIPKQTFFRTEAEKAVIIENKAVDEPPPRFYRLHSERAATPDGKSALIDPQAALAFDLEDVDNHGFRIAPPPSYGSDEIVAEIAENYWMAILRDIPFQEYENPANMDVAAALADLNQYDETTLKVPRDEKTGRITGKTLFRGNTPGDLVGPYVSQFLLREVPFGAYFVAQKVQVGYPKIKGTDGNLYDQVFLVTPEDWYASQLGLLLPKVDIDPKADKFNYRARELSNYVHIDELFQGYLNAELILNAGPPRGQGAPISDGNPYKRSKTQTGFGTLGQPNFASAVAEVATRALKTVWYQKWSVHRRLRPEAFAGHIHYAKTNPNVHYPLAAGAIQKLASVLQAVSKYNALRNGTGYFLPMAFRDGCPEHPSYGAGHATVAGACVTLLKAFYDDQAPFASLPDPTIFVPSSDGEKLFSLNKDTPTQPGCPYTFNDLKDKMTVGGELNKLASNISLARNFAGVHWLSDHAASLPLGEMVAVKFLQEIVETYNENVSFTFTAFDGRRISITKT